MSDEGEIHLTRRERAIYRAGVKAGFEWAEKWVSDAFDPRRVADFALLESPDTEQIEEELSYEEESDA